MMKIKAVTMLFGVSIALGLVSSAMAANPAETVELGVDFEISRCVPASTPTPPNGGVVSESCDATASLPGNIAVQLTSCSSSQGITSCFGTWESTKSRDGYSFDASVTVAKTTITDSSGNSSVNYSLSASVGPVLNSQQPNSVQMNLNRGGAVTDSVIFSGPQLVVSNNDSYVPSLVIAPKMPTPNGR